MSTKTNRICGGCTACCKVTSVDAIGKPFGKWCQHCNIGVGCKIYNDRPDDCKHFRCLWLKGFGKEEDRPDRSKLMLDFVRSMPGFPPNGVLQIFEVTEGACTNSFSMKVTKFTLRKGVCVLQIHLNNTSTFILPDSWAALVSEIDLEKGMSATTESEFLKNTNTER